MLKIMAAARRRPGMTHAEYCAYILDTHARLSVAEPLGLARYVQNHVYDGAFGSDDSNSHVGVFHRDSVTELYFASPEDMQRTFAHPYTREVISPDGANFAELATMATMLTREGVILAPEQVSGATKVMHFLAATADGSLAQVQAAWASAHSAALQQVPDMAKRLRGAVRSDVHEPAGGGPGAHFGGAQDNPVALVTSLWIDDADVDLFRAYERIVLSEPAFDAGRSYFLLTREKQIFAA